MLNYGDDTAFFQVTLAQAKSTNFRPDCGWYWDKSVYGRVVIGNPNRYLNDHFNRHNVSSGIYGAKFF